MANEQKNWKKNIVRERTMETKTSARWEVLEENANLRLDCVVQQITITVVARKIVNATVNLSTGKRETELS